MLRVGLRTNMLFSCMVSSSIFHQGILEIPKVFLKGNTLKHSFHDIFEKKYYFRLKNQRYRTASLPRDSRNVRWADKYDNILINSSKTEDIELKPQCCEPLEVFCCFGDA